MIISLKNAKQFKKDKKNYSSLYRGMEKDGAIFASYKKKAIEPILRRIIKDAFSARR